MFDALSEFLTTFSGSHPLPWSLFVMAVVAGFSLVLFFFWEVVFRLLSAVNPFRRIQRGE
jgi:hypothetical protein